MPESEPEYQPRSHRPRLRTLGPNTGERHASWLELFFDLVFVLAVAQTAKILTDQTDPAGFLKFIILFLPIWYAWIGFTFYADRFESDEASYRVLMFAGMLAVTGLSLTLNGAFTSPGDTAFAVCYAIVLTLLVLLYARAAFYIPLARPYCKQFIMGLSAAAIVLLASLLVSPPYRYGFWALALLLELAVPFFNIKATRLIPIDRSHIPERLGLFTIIVLGEAVIATATGAGATPWNFLSITTASLGFGMAACIWWINFDFVEDNAITSNSLVKRFVFLYAHFLIVASIVAIGIGVEHSIKISTEAHLHTAELLLIAAGTAVFLGVITVVRLVTGICSVVWVRLVSIVLSLSLILLGAYIPPVAVIAAIFVILLVNILIEGRYSGEEKEIEEMTHLVPCEHADQIIADRPRSQNGCEECRKNNYKWVHLRLCLTCGHVGCCDSSVHKHATKHFHTTGHPIIASLEAGESWAWCYEHERFVPAQGVADPSSGNEDRD